MHSVFRRHTVGIVQMELYGKKTDRILRKVSNENNRPVGTKVRISNARLQQPNTPSKHNIFWNALVLTWSMKHEYFKNILH